MTTEPKGVKQNHAVPGSPPDLRPVSRENWKMFSTLEDAEKGLEMIRTVVSDAQMRDATEGSYSQFVYDDDDPDVRARLAYGKVGQLAILEFPAWILDRSKEPQMFIDHYQRGQTPVLKCREATPE